MKHNSKPKRQAAALSAWRYLVMGMTVVVVIGSVLLFHDRINALLTDADGPEQAEEGAQTPMERGAAKSEGSTGQTGSASDLNHPSSTSTVQTPLSAKQGAPADVVVASAAKKEPTEDNVAQVPGELKLTGISPSPLIGKDEMQRVILQGSGFVDGSSVAISRGDRVEVLPSEKTFYLDSSRIAVEVNTGIKAATWAVLVSTPDKRLSNAVQFQVLGPNAEDGSVDDVKSTQAPLLPTKTLPKEPEVQKIKRPEWLAEQQKQNYTLQLLASDNWETIGHFAERDGLSGPLASFVVDKDGKALYVLTQGSYLNREEAEHAAKSLPDGIKPWIRSMESVQQEMRANEKAASRTEVGNTQVNLEIKDMAWLWSQDPARFTIQLAGAESEQSLKGAMREITLPEQLAIVRTLREGKPWYALVYGSFVDKGKAREAIQGLPQPLQQLGPWPRSFASLHDEVSSSTPVQ